MIGSVCDCHVHVFGDGVELPFTPGRAYTPAPATLADMAAVHRRLGVERAVIVQPSVYGTDNRLLLRALAERGEACTRGVVSIDAHVDRTQLMRWHRAGVRGVRINTQFRGGGRLEDAGVIADWLRELGWHLQLLVDISRLPQLYQRFRDFPVPVVFDHFGHFALDSGAGRQAFDDLLRLLDAGHCWVKLSAPYRLVESPAGDATITALARALFAANPQRLVWGSDWPHPGYVVAPEAELDMMSALLNEAPGPRERERVLIDNPAELYDF